MEELLEKLSKIANVKAVALVDSSGAPVSYSSSDPDFQIEYLSSLIPLIANPLISAPAELEEAQLGNFKSAMLEYDNYTLMIYSLSEGAMFLATLIEKNAPNLGLIMLHSENVANQVATMI